MKAQDALQDRMSFSCSGSLSQCFDQLEDSIDIRFNYRNKLCDDIQVNLSYSDQSLLSILNQTLEKNGLSFDYYGGKNIYIKPLNKGTNNLSGIVIDAQSRERIVGARIKNISTGQIYLTNNEGFFSLSSSEDSLNILINAYGYSPIEDTLNFITGKFLIIRLKSVYDLEELEVREAKSSQSVPAEVSIWDEVITSETFNMPTIGGDIDVLNNLKLLGGVQGGGQGESGLIVRGGSPEQNLVLLDGVPIYNSYHLLGIYSVFNEAVINNVSLHKGAFPARYGGRLSSVVDITLKEGNKDTFLGKGSVGLIASDLTLEGPIGKKETSFIISGRRTYYDLLARPIKFFQELNTDESNNTGFYFYDVFGKISHQTSPRSRISLSVFNGNDRAFFNSTTRIEDTALVKESIEGAFTWQNFLTSLRWSYVINKKTFLNINSGFVRNGLEFSDDYSLEIENTNRINNSLVYTSSLRDIFMKAELEKSTISKQRIIIGSEAIFHTFQPANQRLVNTSSIGSIDTTIGTNVIKGLEFSAYVDDEIRYSSKGILNIGLRYTAFQVEGKTYQSFQPRMSIQQQLGDNYTVGLSLTDMQQFVHLLPNNNLGIPIDIWLPVTQQIEPLRAQQINLSVKAQFKHLTLSLSGYTKRFENLIEYKEGVDLLNSEDNWTDAVTSGSGQAQGVEFTANITLENLQIFSSYTLSKSTRIFNGINGGEEFPNKFDRRHNYSLLVSRKINKKWTLSGSWSFLSGNPITIPTSKYLTWVNGSPLVVENYGLRNNYRMPSSHHLDFHLNYKAKPIPTSASWTIGVYNLYNRYNPFMLFTGLNDEGNLSLKVRTYLPVLPFLKYSFHF